MERVKQKMEEAIKQRKRLQATSQIASESEQTTHKSIATPEGPGKLLSISHIAYLLIGCTAGIAISAITWWVKSAGTTDYSRMVALDSVEAIQVRKINNSIDNVAHLTERIATLTNTITGLEVKLRDTLALVNDKTDQGDKSVTAKPESALHEIVSKDTVAIIDKGNTEIAFIPTHSVSTSLNFRPSPSLSATPIAVLKAGTKVKYINERNGWYFVNTESYGEGWCSSEYLSPITVDSTPASNMEEPSASTEINAGANQEIVFKPTHIVSTRLNFRPSPSLSATPIAVLKVGTKVKYINERNGWYFVTTESYGKGWCSSEYLSPL